MVADNILHVCRAGGVEMFGLHTTVAPRRQNTQAAPTLEEFQFVPYVEKDISVHNRTLTDYMCKCESFIKQNITKVVGNNCEVQLPNTELLKKHVVYSNNDFEEIKPDDLVTYINDQNHCLIKVMRDTFSQTVDSNFAENVSNIINSHKDDIHNDVLMSNLLSAKTLKPMLDIVVENSGASKMKVVEVEAGKGCLYNRVLHHLNSQPMMNVNYIATDSSVESVLQEAVQSLNADVAEWSLDKEPKNDICGAHLVVANNVLHNQSNIPQTLEVISKALKDDGFLLIHETTSNFAIPLSLHSLMNKISSSRERTSLPFMTDTEWLSFLNDANLEVVSHKTDGLLSSLFLCRKRSDSPSEITKLSVDSLSFDWLDDLKTAIYEHSKLDASHRLWLSANTNTQSGILGMVNCLRQEPGGDRIR